MSRVNGWQSALLLVACVLYTATLAAKAPAQRGRGAGGGAPQTDAAPAAATPATPAPAGNVPRGKELFTTYYCYSCHGSDGQGGAGAKIAPNPPAYNTLRSYVRKPTGGMPPYISKSLPDADLADIYAYLKSIPPEPTADKIALLKLE